MNAAELARQVREAGLDVPVVLLAYDSRELADFVARTAYTSGLERIFLWQGDARILLAIVKSSRTGATSPTTPGPWACR